MTNISLPSVQSLLLEMSANGKPLAVGTGFVAETSRGPALVTNWHNLAGRNPATKQPMSPTGAVPDQVRIVHNRKGKLGEWVIRAEKLQDGKDRRWIEHPTLGDKVDVVALPLTDLSDVHLYPYQITGGPGVAVNPAEPLSVVGFPFGIQAGGSLAIWATGFIASEPAIDFQDLPTFLVDCRTRQGQSGSPVIAHRNGGAVAMEDGSTELIAGPVTRFMGVYSGRINDQSDIGIVWKASAVAQLLDSIK